MLQKVYSDYLPAPLLSCIDCRICREPGLPSPVGTDFGTPSPQPPSPSDSGVPRVSRVGMCWKSSGPHPAQHLEQYSHHGMNTLVKLLPLRIL